MPFKLPVNPTQCHMIHIRNSVFCRNRHLCCVAGYHCLQRPASCMHRCMTSVYIHASVRSTNSRTQVNNTKTEHDLVAGNVPHNISQPLLRRGPECQRVIKTERVAQAGRLAVELPAAGRVRVVQEAEEQHDSIAAARRQAGGLAVEGARGRRGQRRRTRSELAPALRLRIRSLRTDDSRPRSMM